jgi:uncharacterized protein YbjT (DUF2867 family)
VIGSTGNVGTATIHALAAKGIPTRAGVRDPTSEKAVALAALDGVVVVEADLSNPSTLAGAMTAVAGVYIVTPGNESRAELVAAGVAAAKAAGVPHIVAVSVPSIEAGGELVFKNQFLSIEASISTSGLPFTLLRLPMFFENQFASQGSIKGQGKLYGPADPSKSLSLVGVADVGAASAAVLANLKGHVNKTYTLASEPTTFDQIAAAFSAAVGKEVAYVRVPYTAAEESMVGMGFPVWMAKGVLELLQLVDSGAGVYDARDLTKLLGCAPTSFGAWAHSVAGGFKA